MSAKLSVIRDESPVECVVKALEEALERARNGELRGLVLAWDAKGSFGHHVALGRDSTPMAIVGELALAQFTVLIESGRIKPP